MSEWIDIRNEDGSLSGRKKERSRIHEDGDLHATSHIWIVRGNAEEGFDVLLQRRSLNKDAYPGCYDISSAGHIPAGDDFVPSALREMEEELGIRAQASDLEFAGTIQYEFKKIFHGKWFHNRELAGIFVCRKPVEAEKLTLQKEEVESVRWMTLDEIFTRVRDHDPGFCIIEEELLILKNHLEKNKRNNME